MSLPNLALRLRSRARGVVVQFSPLRSPPRRQQRLPLHRRPHSQYHGSTFVPSPATYQCTRAIPQYKRL